MKNKSFQINLITEQEGGYTVIVPQLPGCVSYGKTVEVAKKNAQEAIELHLANLKAHSKKNFKIVVDKTVLSTAIQIKSSYA